MPEEKLQLKAWKYKPKGRRDVGRLRKCCEQEQIDRKPNPYSEEEDEDATLTASHYQLRSSCQSLRVKKSLKIIRH
jgi:hypothetical protein